MSRGKHDSFADGVRLGSVLLTAVPIQFALAPASASGSPPGSERALGDMDADGDVDLADYALVQACYGVIESPPPDTCPVARLALLDADGDGSLDESEFGQFADCMSGPDQPVPPECLQPPLAVSIVGASSAEDGHSVDLVASVTGAVGNVLYDWQLLAGSAVLDDPAVMDPTLWMTANQNVLVEVTARDVASNGITIDTAVDQHEITAVAHPQYTFEIFAGGDQVLVAGSTSTIDLFGAYFDPAACPQQAIYWEWDAVSIPLPEGGWFDKPHRLGTPSEPVRFTPLGSWVPGDYVFSLFAHNSCSGLEDEDTVVVSLRLECVSDEDCGDALFCNGIETCDANGFCQPGSDPCLPGTFCDEASDSCGPPIGQKLNFTLQIDTLVGGPGDDIFNAPLAFNSGTGGLSPTLQNGDSADGMGGIDTLNATYSNPGSPDVILAPTLSGIEVLNLTDLGPDSFGAFPSPPYGTAISAVNFTGVTTINDQNSFANVTVNNLNALTNLGVFNSDFDLNVSYVSSASSGMADSRTLTLNGARDSDLDADGGGPDLDTAGCTVNITTPPNGLETLNIVTTGQSENVLEALLQNGGTTLTTLNISGPAPFRVRPISASYGPSLPGTLTTIDCSLATGGTDLTVSGTTNVLYTGGSGDDVISFAGTYTGGDTINGGGGTNTLGVNSAQAVSAVTNQTNVTNIQTIFIPDGLNGALDVTRFGANDAVLDTTAAATFLTAGNSTIALRAGSRTMTLNNDDTAHTLGVTILDNDVNDVLTLNLRNADLGNTITLTGAEPVDLSSGHGLNGTPADGNTNTAVSITLVPTIGTGTLNIQGAVAFTLTGAITANTINASAAGAAFTMGTATVAATGAIITGSAFNDTLIGSANADNINAGDGDDIVRGDAGVDPIITLGVGADILRITALGANGVDRKNVTDFNDSLGIGDVLSLDPNVGGFLSGTDNFTSAASIQNHGVAGPLTVAGATEVVRVNSATVANFTEANSLNGTNLLTAIGGAITVQANGNQHLFVMADASGNEGVYYGDAGADSGIVAGELTLISVLQGGNVVLGDLVFNNFANN